VPSIKKRIQDRYGWIRIAEARNKIMLGHTAPPLRRFEDAEVARLAPTLPVRSHRPLVATVIPTYRRPEGVVRALRSVLAQSVEDQVVIVVDDGAGLPELPGDPRVVAVSLSRNSGVAGVVRNVGLRLTDSEFVAFLDDDNLWLPHHLETALGRLRDESQPAVDAVYTSLRRVLPDGTERDILSVPFDRRLAAGSAFLDVNAFVARRSQAIRFSRIRRGRAVVPVEDWEMIYRYSGRHLIAHVPVPTVEYLINPESYWTVWSASETS
jgi:glycosyltransferase involved in cell wall biosynthesis